MHLWRVPDACVVTKAKVDMHLDHVMMRVEGATDEVLHALALQVEGVTKRNIVNNNQVDTGFMLNSVYSASEKGDTFGETWGAGSYYGKKSDSMKDVTKARKLRLPNLFSAAAVHVSAMYAIFQEMMDPFLRPAADEVASYSKGVAESVYKRALHD